MALMVVALSSSVGNLVVQTKNCGKSSRTCQRNKGRLSMVTVSSRKWNLWMMRNWKQPTLNRYKPNKRWCCWWLSNLQKNAKTVNQGNPGFQSHMSGHISDQVAQHTVLSVFKSVLSMQSIGCHGVSEQLMAAGATEEDVHKISQVMAQTLETGSRILNLAPRRTASRAKWWARMRSSPMDYAHPVSAKLTPKDKKPSRGACQTPSQKRDDWRRNANRKEKVCSLLRLWTWIQIIAVFFYLSLSRIG